ncbi:basic proline-rich protein-like [Iris pallida]|uniref:Basic proline-rich protein-like n=1 Tax=Iris pallida TaxID=29817 RepID=A0AAX6HHT7_IRIPA|nr:basic proline-rich protein-like [Iris pallida]
MVDSLRCGRWRMLHERQRRSADGGCAAHSTTGAGAGPSTQRARPVASFAEAATRRLPTGRGRPRSQIEMLRWST